MDSSEEKKGKGLKRKVDPAKDFPEKKRKPEADLKNVPFEFDVFFRKKLIASISGRMVVYNGIAHILDGKLNKKKRNYNDSRTVLMPNPSVKDMHNLILSMLNRMMSQALLEVDGVKTETMTRSLASYVADTLMPSLEKE